MTATVSVQRAQTATDYVTGHLGESLNKVSAELTARMRNNELSVVTSDKN